MKRIGQVLKEKRAEGYVDIVVLVLCAVLVLALAVRVLPVFIAKQQLDTFATELMREAEISGRIDTETDRRAAILQEKTGLTPDISWSADGRVQLNEKMSWLRSGHPAGAVGGKIGGLLEVRWMPLAKKIRWLLKDRQGASFPFMIAVTLSLVIIFCGVSEYFRLQVIAAGVKEAVEDAVISAVNDNYGGVYHGVREGYSGGYMPDGEEGWEMAVSEGDIYAAW